jgi:hypothetical protein
MRGKNDFIARQQANRTPCEDKSIRSIADSNGVPDAEVTSEVPLKVNQVLLLNESSPSQNVAKDRDVVFFGGCEGLFVIEERD